MKMLFAAALLVMPLSASAQTTFLKKDLGQSGPYRVCLYVDGSIQSVTGLCPQQYERSARQSSIPAIPPPSDQLFQSALDADPGKAMDENQERDLKIRLLQAQVKAAETQNAPANPTPGKKTSNEVLMLYGNGNETLRAGILLAVQGIERGLMWANADLIAERKEVPLYCQPQNLDLTAEQVIDILQKSIAKDPSLGDAPIALAVFWSLKKTFPCTNPPR